MSQKHDWQPIIRTISKNQRFVVATHINPDGDAIGSQMGLYYLLKKLGKSVTLLNNDKTPANYRFLDPDDVITQFKPEKHTSYLSSADVLIVVDTNSYERIGSVGEAAAKLDLSVICIDHHLTQNNFGDPRLIDIDASSAGELVYYLIKGMNVEFDYELARSIYAAMLTDTGSFRYPKTTAQIHRIVAELLDHGVEPNKVYEAIYEMFTDAALRLLGLTLSHLRKYENGQIVCLVVTLEMMAKTGADAFDIEGLVNYSMKIQGVKIGILFKEDKNNITKISIRSKGNYNVTIPAQKFSGGGHFHAAGIRMERPLETAIDLVVGECIQLLHAAE